MFDDIDVNEREFFESNDYDGEGEYSSNLFFSQDDDNHMKIAPILFNKLFCVNQSDSYSYDRNLEDGLMNNNQQQKSQIDKESHDSNEENDECNNCSKPLNTKNSSSNVFSVTKDYSIRENTNQRMKKKVEHTKLLLGEKRLKDDIEGETTISYKKIINNNKLKCTKEMSFEEKKKMKVIRNRLSAQKSRDKQKIIMNSLYQTNSMLKNENEQMRKLINEQQNNTNEMINTMNQCNNCREVLRMMKQQPTSYISEDSTISSGGGSGRRWTGTLSFIGLLCFFGFIMFLGQISFTNNKNNYLVNNNRMLTQIDYINNNNHQQQNFPIIKYVNNSDDLIVTDDNSNDSNLYENNNNEDNRKDYYITNDSIMEMVNNHPLKKQIIELLNKNYPVKKDSSKRNISIMIALREQFLIGLFNKLQINNNSSLQSRNNDNNKIPRKRNNLQFERNKESQMMSYEFPICYNPNHIEYEMKKLSLVPNSNDNTLPVTFGITTKGQKSHFNSKVQTVYINNYFTTTTATTTESPSSLSSNQIDFESIIENLNNKKSSSTSEDQGDCHYFHFIFPVNTIPNQEDNDNTTIDNDDNQEEPLISSVNHTYTKSTNNERHHEERDTIKKNMNSESLYEVGCKVFSITKIIK